MNAERTRGGSRRRAPGAALLLALELTAHTFDRRRALERLLFGCGFFLVGLYGAAVVEAKAFNLYQDRQLERLSSETVASAPAPREPLLDGELIGRLEIERLGLHVAVVEGTSAATLRRGLGHVPNTALPGEAGNVAIAGHRDSHFSELGEVREGDRIVLVTPEGEHAYIVQSTLVTEPDDVSQLGPVAGERLTLITCYPFHWVGPAPKRFIVHAEREDSSLEQDARRSS